MCGWRLRWRRIWIRRFWWWMKCWRWAISRFQKKCLGKMSEVSRGGRTVLFVSHNMAAIENLCTRGVVLHQGELSFDGTAKDAIQYYLNSLSVRSGTGHVVELDGVGDRRSIVAPLLRRLEFLTENEQPLTEGLPIGSRLKVKVHFDLPDATCELQRRAGIQQQLWASHLYGAQHVRAQSLGKRTAWALKFSAARFPASR